MGSLRVKKPQNRKDINHSLLSCCEKKCQNSLRDDFLFHLSNRRFFETSIEQLLAVLKSILCIKELGSNLVTVARWIFFGHFWTKLHFWVRSSAKIFLCLKPNHCHFTLAKNHDVLGTRKPIDTSFIYIFEVFIASASLKLPSSVIIFSNDFLRTVKSQRLVRFCH